MPPKKFSFLFFFIDLMVTILSFFAIIYFSKQREMYYIKLYIYPFCGFYVIWVTSSLINQKYHRYQYYYEAINSIGKNFIYSLLLAISAIYIFNRFSYSRLLVFGTIFIASLLNFLTFAIYFINQKYKTINRDDVGTGDLVLEDEEDEVISFAGQQTDHSLFDYPEIDEKTSITELLRSRYLATLPFLFDFVQDNIPIQRIPVADSHVINSANIFNIQNTDPESKLLFINLRKANDLRRFNQYFIQVNENLRYGGYFVGMCETNEIRQKSLKRRFPVIISHLAILIDFGIHRVIPKLPYLKSIYFFLTQGSNRPVSKSEILGRLSFCGFKIIDTAVIERKFYFVVQKTHLYRSDIIPSYGPFIKLRRIGKDKQIIFIYKFRTMHPFSEFLQDYMYRQNQLDEGGKIKNDFRVTEWGRIFRKFWIDEFPQFINFFRGEIKLVGVRALSEHYFSLYPKDLQDLRTRCKPGLVPPFYVDMPKTFDEIVESERKYLTRYFKSPWTTDFRYFFLSFYNIFFKKARSK